MVQLTIFLSNQNCRKGFCLHSKLFVKSDKGELLSFENLLEFYRKSDGKTKKKILACIFSKILVLEKGKVGGKDRRPKSEVSSRL
jgi:hypothetical protein